MGAVMVSLDGGGYPFLGNLSLNTICKTCGFHLPIKSPSVGTFRITLPRVAPSPPHFFFFFPPMPRRVSAQDTSIPVRPKVLVLETRSWFFFFNLGAPLTTFKFGPPNIDCNSLLVHSKERCHLQRHYTFGGRDYDFHQSPDSFNCQKVCPYLLFILLYFIFAFHPLLLR